MVRYRSLDAVTVLTVYVVLATLVPAHLVVPAMGGVGTPANVFAVLVLLWYLASWLAGRLTPPPGTRAPRLAMCLFAAVVLLSYVAAALRSPTVMELQAADRGLIQLCAWIGLIVAASGGIRDSAGLHRLLRRLVVCGTVMAAIGAIEFFLRKDFVAGISIPGLQNSTTPLQLMDRGAFVRPSSTATHPLEFGAVMMLLLPFALQQAFALTDRRPLRRWAPVCLIAATAPLTVSRTSVIGLIVVLGLTIPTWNAQRRWPAMIALVSGFGVFKVITPGLLGAIGGLFTAMLHGGDSSTQARTMDYAGVAQYVVQRPWTGRGFGTFLPELYRYTDNMYLLALVEIGILGVLAIVALGVTMVHCGGSGRRRYTSTAERDLGQAFVAAGAVALVCSATFDTLSFTIFGGVFFLLLGCAGAYLGAARRQESALPSLHAPTGGP